MLKRFFSIITISLIIIGSFFSVYSFEDSVYADSTTDEWLNVTTNQQLVEAFRYYCKSRDLTIDGSIADGVTSFTTNTFNGLCNTLGIDMTALQAQIKYKTDGNTGLQFLFSNTGINAYNRIFSQFLQDNDLEVGDTVNDKTLFDGKYYGNTLIYSFPFSVSYGEVSGTPSVSNISVYGTPLQYTNSMLLSMWNNNESNFSVTWNEKTASFTMREYAVTVNNEIKRVLTTSDNNKGIISRDFESNLPKGFGFPVVVNHPDYPRYYCIGIITFYENDTYSFNPAMNPFTKDNVLPLTVYITTNNTTINNNNYEGDTIINNNGDTNNYYPDNPDNPDLPTSNPTIPDSGGWQDFTLPDMPNDWLIYGMEKKFPFDIPFNIMFALSLLNHEPEIPKFEGDIDLNVCTWHYDIDLTPFDDIATILRKFEVLAFIIGLAILTKNLINWG